jgi:hypothetical protein
MKSVKFISTALALTLLVFSHTFALCTSEFPFNQLEAEIQIASPLDNGSYTGNVCLNISIEFYAFSRVANSSAIPYENVTCSYQLDNEPFLDASIYYASQQGGFTDIPNGGYWNIVRCNYTASLQELSNGWHSLQISLEPGGITYYRVNASIAEVPPTDYFYVYQPNPTTKPTSSIPEFPVSIIALSAGIATIALVVLLKRKKASSTNRQRVNSRFSQF